MTDLAKALGDIQSIRRQVAASTEFKGYGPATLCGTAGIALLAGIAQRVWLPVPLARPALYVALWLATAVLSATLILAQMLFRANRLHLGMADEMVFTAITQFLPAGITGALLPFVLLRIGAAVLWLLPGLWQLVFSLGVFASCRGLPRPMLLVGVWFFATGFLALGVGSDRALHPAVMALAFAPGMTLVALIHHRFARQGDGNETEIL